MPKENVRKHLLKAKDLMKSAQDEIDEALSELEYDDEEETQEDNDTGFGFIGKDGIERVSEEENWEAEDED